MGATVVGDDVVGLGEIVGGGGMVVGAGGAVVISGALVVAFTTGEVVAGKTVASITWRISIDGS